MRSWRHSPQRSRFEMSNLCNRAARARHGLALAALAVVLPAATAWSGAPADWDPNQLKSKVTEFTLKNGMRFIVLERHDSPVFSFFTHVNAGSVNEEVGQTGLAHMF